MILLPFLAAIGFLVALAKANTEKIIFTAPEYINLGDARPSLSDLQLDTFTPTELQLRTALPVAFPNDQEAFGLQSWYLLQALTQGQRYEVRVCWPASVRVSFLARPIVVGSVCQLLTHYSATYAIRPRDIQHHTRL